MLFLQLTYFLIYLCNCCAFLGGPFSLSLRTSLLFPDKFFKYTIYHILLFSLTTYIDFRYYYFNRVSSPHIMYGFHDADYQLLRFR